MGYTRILDRSLMVFVLMWWGGGGKEILGEVSGIGGWIGFFLGAGYMSERLASFC